MRNSFQVPLVRVSTLNVSDEPPTLGVIIKCIQNRLCNQVIEWCVCVVCVHAHIMPCSCSSSGELGGTLSALSAVLLFRNFFIKLLSFCAPECQFFPDSDSVCARVCEGWVASEMIESVKEEGI